MLLSGGYLGIPRVFFGGQDSLGYVRVLMLFPVTFDMAHIEGQFALDATENLT